MQHRYTVRMTLAYRGARYASLEQAEAVLARFAGLEAAVVERSADEVLVEVAEQRGPAGAYRLHALACDAGIPVVCDTAAA